MKSKPRFSKAKLKDTFHSGFYRYLNVSYSELVEKLGKPHDCTKEGEWRSGDGKIRVQWAFKNRSIKKPTVMTIYDYKDDRPIDTIKDWHIGARGDRAKIDEFLKSHFAEEALSH